MRTLEMVVLSQARRVKPEKTGDQNIYLLEAKGGGRKLATQFDSHTCHSVAQYPGLKTASSAHNGSFWNSLS